MKRASDPIHTIATERRHTGGMIRQVAEFDWSATSLGPMSQWPESLRAAVSICLNSKFPMFVWWGAELINIYNDAYIPVLGKRHPAALGRPARTIWHEIWDTLGPQVEAVMVRGEATWNERVRLNMERQGYQEETYFTWSYSPILDDAGNIGGLFCACTEETQRVLAERERDAAQRERDRLAEQQRRADERARTILESITDAFFAVDRDWRFSYLNPQAVRVLGRSDLIGTNIWEEYPGLIGSDFERAYRLAANEGVTSSVTAFYPDHDRWYEVHAYPAPEGFSVYFRNVTARKRDEEALRRSEERFRQLADAMPQIVWAARPDGVVDYYNKRWFEYTGLPDDGRIGEESWSMVPDAEGLARIHEVWGRSVRTGEPYEIEYRFRRRDGMYRWHLGRAVPIRDEAGNIIRWYGTNTDIHDQKLFQEALSREIAARRQAEAERERLLDSERAARLESERTGRMKDEFLATLSHELRTPLNAILGWSHIIQRSPGLSQDAAQGLEVIERNARAQAQIIEDLLDMSRIISGKVRLDVQRLDLSAIVHAAVETARPTAEAKGVRLMSVVDPLHGVQVTGDASRLQQVLWNLLSNAIKFTGRGGQVQVLLERVDSHLEVSVTDSGEGIKPEFLPFVFDRFRQADASTTRRHGGLGLGLSIVKQLVELHGGSIRVQSEGPGKGASFIVSLPLTVLSTEPPGGLHDRRHPQRTGRFDGIPDACVEVRGVRVLVVDDEPDARALVQRLLQDCEAVVATAGSAEEAVSLLRQQEFDVLISDIGMPLEDGYALIRRVRALGEPNGRIPAIALTAYARAEDRVKAIVAGFQMHVAKPVEPVELVTMVAGATGRTGSPPEFSTESRAS